MGRKKILWLCSWYPDRHDPFNGDFIQRHARAAALYNDIYVIHLSGDITGGTKKSFKEVNKTGNLTEHIVYYPKSITFWGKVVSNIRWLFLFKKAIRNYIIENGKPDMIHVHVPMKAGILALWMKKYYKIPFVVTEHWGIYNDIEEHNYNTNNWIFKKYTQKIFEKAAKFISVSKFIAEGVNSQVVSKEYILLPNTVNTDLFYYKEKTDSIFRFIHVSNMVPLKNAEGILRSFKSLQSKYPAVELLMVGDRDMAIREYAKDLGLSPTHVIFLGEVSYKQVAEEIQMSDCLLLFSNIENSPCVIGEALCSGVPVISSEVGGVPELVNESNALLVDRGDESQLVAAMLKMINRYTDYNRTKIAEDAKNKFSYPVIGKKLDEIYSIIAANK